ncbi:DNA recombination protein RmuC [Aureivirga sp. CE67]|uniref:DNA recombination protein RmuC n=1 Tax=Aureivirga sp. CE67 TaxID=1788983 RepID=UPI0018C9C941|nr:DNA recombination protein RmuC [Aureivirga sp. CE67]
MQQIIISISSIAIGAIAGFLYSKLQASKKSNTLNEDLQKKTTELAHLQNMLETTQMEKKQAIEELKLELEDLRNEKEDVLIEYTRRNSENVLLKEKLQEQKKEILNLQEKFSVEFENLANKILEEKAEKFTKQNHINLQQILNPLQEKIQTFEKKVEETHKDTIDRHAALREQIFGLEKLNLQMSKDALNLTKALKGDSKMQGNWGEIILERVLEKSGLEKGREFEMEKSFSVNYENRTRLRPDVIIHLPENRKMIIDSKVSLTAYEKYINCEEETLKPTLLKEHITSINRHVMQLSGKRYEDLYQIESPDFVLLFIPIEPAFAVASKMDPNLYNNAFSKNIVIVTPSTLLATLRTINSIWQNEKQKRNAIQIAQQAGAMYDKFEGLIQNLIKIGKRLDDAKTEYSGAMNKLCEGKGNIVVSMEKLKDMGAKAKKSLPESVVERSLP